jgi:hypothetical protein
VILSFLHEKPPGNYLSHVVVQAEVDDLLDKTINTTKNNAETLLQAVKQLVSRIFT